MFLLGLGGGCHDEADLYKITKRYQSEVLVHFSLSTNLDRLCLTMEDLKTK